ncbi:MAG: carboxymuconolactone decarboxylase family protein [Clostridia bacterium]|nr:carboxymuconolactone decarboxylase family protein [Clostridia bacterium]
MYKEELAAVPFGLGEPNPYNKFFTGTSYLNILHTDGVLVANVTFEPGCRNFWHVHEATKDGGQILIVTYGRGYYQEFGKDPQELLPGDFVFIAPGVKHWHGAASDSVFSHLALEVPGEGTSTTWCESVSDREYAEVNSFHKSTPVQQTAGRDQLGAIAPEFARLNDDILFGEVWSRGSYLDIKKRCILTIVALTSQGLTDSSLLYHVKNAKNQGVGKNELVESLTHIAMYVGWSKIWAVMRYVKEVYAPKEQ